MNPFLDLEVPNLPYPYPVTYREYAEMQTYFIQKYMSYYLNSNKEDYNGNNIYSKNIFT